MLVVVTRARDDGGRTAARLRDAGHEPVLAPVIEIRALPVNVHPGLFDGVIATSAHAFAPWAAPGEALAARPGTPVFAVGARTAEAARSAGFRDVRIASGAGAGLVELIRLTAPRRARLLYLAGLDRKPVVEQALAEDGADLSVVETYVAASAERFDAGVAARLAGAERAAVLHFSRRSAELCLSLAEAAGLGAAMRRFVHAAISQDAAAPLRAAGLAALVAKSPDEAELIAILPD